MTHPLPTLLPPATRFLLEQVCLPGTNTQTSAPPAAELAREARQQLIAGLLHAWTLAQPPGALRSGLLRELAPDQPRRAIGGLNLVGETLRLVQLLGRHGIHALVLKGPLLSRRYYGDFGLRDAGDVDLLVDEAAATEADRCLQDAGYARIKPCKPLQGRRLKLYFDTQHEFGYVAAGGTSVELHWRFADCRRISGEPFSGLWERAETVEAAGAELRVLSPSDTFLQLAIHGFTDGWSRLKWIADLPRVLAVLPVIPVIPVIPAKAGIQNGIGRIVELALTLAGRSQPTAWQMPALRYVATRLQNPHPRTLPVMDRLRHAVAARRYNDTVLNDVTLNRAAAYCNLIMPADFDRLPLPDALTPALPYLARVQRGLGLGFLNA